MTDDEIIISAARAVKWHALPTDRPEVSIHEIATVGSLLIAEARGPGIGGDYIGTALVALPGVRRTFSCTTMLEAKARAAGPFLDFCVCARLIPAPLLPVEQAPLVEGDQADD